MDDDATQIAIRPMRRDEYDTFEERSLREYTEEIAANLRVSPDAARPKATSSFQSLLSDGFDTPDHHLFVIEADGAPVGELWLGMRDAPGGLEAFGYDFWIRPELRDHGIGRRAMALGAEAARELGAVRLMLNVFGDNERARHLYDSFGFRVTSTNMVMDLPAVD